ncbi:MAG: hypothetical protein HY298_09410 [Verrucomicrobia bacterium]|nr:hypothetical protein [Verrucomicrobiota bacterium]
MNPRHHERFRGFRARVGLSRWDITPPAGAYARNWGAAKQWFTTGVHRRLTGTALALALLSRGGSPLVLISLELGWWRSRKDADTARQRVLTELALPDANLIIHLSHTHAGPALDSDAPPEANPEAARAYLAWLAEACVQGGRDALAKLQPATALFNHGHCALATQRDLIDPANPERFLTGFNPESAADDTLLVARLFGEDGRTLGTLVNYACHPTTLAWDNPLLSPDYPGAMRELVESQSGGAPCLFLQGASGELAPAEQYSGDVNLADRHGRELGHAALSALAPLESGCSRLNFESTVESGAPLAVWRAAEGDLSEVLRASAPRLPLALKRDLPSVAEIDAALARQPTGFQYERLLRQRRVRSSVGDNDVSTEQFWLWRLGDAALCAVPFEAYSVLQTQLRAAFPETPLLVLNIGNGHLGYLPPGDCYGHDLYTVWQTPFASGGLERLIETAQAGLHLLLAKPPGTIGKGTSP